MNITISELKKLTAKELIARLPIDITADGTVVASISVPGKSMVGTKTKCPNCKLEFLVVPTDGKPFFFSGRHK